MATIHEDKTKFYIGDSPNESIAYIEYKITGEILYIEGTMVDKSLQGQGIGQQLVVYAVEYARKNNLKIIPLCPYARSQFEKHPEYHDVLNPDVFQ